MHQLRFAIGLLTAACWAIFGCAAVQPAPTLAHRPPTASKAPSAHQAAHDKPAATGTPLAPPAEQAPVQAANGFITQAEPGTATGDPPPSASDLQAPTDQAWNELLAEVDSLGELPTELKTRLLADLRQSSPNLRPHVLDAFRASLAYQNRVKPPAEQPIESPDGQAAPHDSEPAAPASPAIPSTASLSSPSPNQDGAVAADAVLPAAAALSVAAPASAIAADEGWKHELRAALEALEHEASAPALDRDQVARHVYLRLLFLTSGRKDDALRPIPGLGASEQDYWIEQLYALSIFLDAQAIANPGLRAAQAAVHLDRAIAMLSQMSLLVVRNLTFCTEVTSYGVYSPLEKNEFRPGQKTLVYAELENFVSEEDAQGFHTALRSSYQILDSQGKRVASDEFALTEEHCRNRRRDYFVRYYLSIPERIYDGAYTLELTVEDTLGRKIGQSTIAFTVHHG